MARVSHLTIKHSPAVGIGHMGRQMLGFWAQPEVDRRPSSSSLSYLNSSVIHSFQAPHVWPDGWALPQQRCWPSAPGEDCPGGRACKGTVVPSGLGLAPAKS